MKPFFAAVALLAAGSAAGEPAIDEAVLKAALQKGTVKIVSLERHLGPPEIPDGAFARACRTWTLTDAQVQSFFARADAISSDELRSAYSIRGKQERYAAVGAVKTKVKEAFTAEEGQEGAPTPQQCENCWPAALMLMERRPLAILAA